MRPINVPLGDRSYDIVVGSGLLDEAATLLERLSRPLDHLVILSDENVDPFYGDRLEKQLCRLGAVQRIVVAAGERSKSWETAGELVERLAAMLTRRTHLLITLGGGVVSDLGGFVAAVYQRGIGVVHIPTTLLGQVDAAIGGKTGVNLSAGKNLAGAFYQPVMVIADTALLETLPDSEFRSGLAEVIKYGLCFDPSILENFASAQYVAGLSGGPRSGRLLEDLVFRCAAIKAAVVSKDENDRSGRIFLNYGHTFGHALEAAGGYSKFSHGEAISVGMMFAAHLANNIGLLDKQSVAMHSSPLQAAGLPVTADFDPNEISLHWRMDKKNEGLQRWVLLEEIGKPVIRSDITDEQLHQAAAGVLS